MTLFRDSKINEISDPQELLDRLELLRAESPEARAQRERDEESEDEAHYSRLFPRAD